jgi:hypothetical protein
MPWTSIGLEFRQQVFFPQPFSRVADNGDRVSPRGNAGRNWP